MNWQPMDTAPKDGTKVLLFIPSPKYGNGFEVASGAFEDNGKWYLSAVWAGTQVHESDQPTHWMPLPEPPNEP